MTGTDTPGRSDGRWSDALESRVAREVRFTALGMSLGVALPVLTATPWLERRGGATDTAWSVPGVEGVIVLGLVLALALATLAVSVFPRVPATALRAVAGLGVLTALMIVLLARSSPSSRPPAAGLWVTAVVAAAVVAVLVLRARDRP